MEELVQQTEQEIINFGKSWRAANPDRKRKIQNALFPEGLAFDSNLYYFCPHNPTLMQLLNDIFESFQTVGVPLNSIFEHLDTTIAEATPLYELCTSLLESASE